MTRVRSLGRESERKQTAGKEGNRRKIKKVQESETLKIYVMIQPDVEPTSDEATIQRKFSLYHHSNHFSYFAEWDERQIDSTNIVQAGGVGTYYFLVPAQYFASLFLNRHFSEWKIFRKFFSASLFLNRLFSKCVFSETCFPKKNDFF